MLNDKDLPKTLQQAIQYFSDKDVCLKFVASMLWADGIAVCPHCGNNTTSFLSTRRIWKCKACKKQFSVKVGTIFEDSPIGLDKWLTAMWLIVGAKNGISSYEIHRAIGVTQKTAWFMAHRLRLAMQSGTFEKLSGNVEVDETFIGGKAKNMHKHKREAIIQGRGSVGKTAVMGLLERKGRVLAKVIERTDRETLHAEVKSNVESGANLFTDEWRSYRGLDEQYIHEVINHSTEYVRGHIHTNGIENFWALLKRTIKGTYVSVEPFHLSRYLDEQMFRFNERKGNDKDRFLEVAKSIGGKRLTYKELIGSSAWQ
ncbi:MAG: IS1595 family transposase [Acidobacteria bacterium]|jgi:transposase-like protein|nr:IS1595 family transposase [Acidobacteriota bacterium]